MLGGVRLREKDGLEGHSDADVLTHAIMDALLGAAGLDDIGSLFPDDDPAYAGADSVKLLGEVVELLARARVAACERGCGGGVRRAAGGPAQAGNARAAGGGHGAGGRTGGSARHDHRRHGFHRAA